MNPLISLVIPVYNVEKYLDKCMESVLAQTYDNFEVILVDDGSTDNSGKMCDEYAKIDSRVAVYHRPNNGPSEARNFGVEHCNAELVSFIDSDDYVTEDYLEHLWYLMSKYDADIACAGRLIVFENNKKQNKRVKKDKIIETVISSMEAIKLSCYEREVTVSPGDKLYKVDIIRKYPYPVGKLYEDLATAYKRFSIANKIVFSNKCLYYYVQRKNSRMHEKFSEKHFDILIAAQEQHEFVCKKYPEIKRTTGSRCASVVLSLMSRFDIFYEANSKELFMKMQNYLKPFFRDALADKNRSVKYKIYCISVMMGYYPAKLVFNSKNFIRKILKGI